MLIPILYGSQTGTGIYLGSLLKSEIPNTILLPIDNFDFKYINSFPLIIFICSTHGDGNCTFNMSKFYRFICRQTDKVFTFNFFFLGLGDSSYAKYNYCAKISISQIKKLGGNLIYHDFCNVQDNNGINDGFNRFFDSLMSYLRKSNLLKSYNKIEDTNLIKNNYDLPISLNDIIKNNKKYKAKILQNKLVTLNDYKYPVYELILEINDYNDFIPGDCISILPKNTLDLSKIFDFTVNQIDKLNEKVDFYSIVPQGIFHDVIQYCKNEKYQQKLNELYSDYDLYYDYIVIPRRNILEVIEDFDLDIPFEYLISILPIIPRYYSFSKINGKYHILYNEIKYKTYLSKERIGLCSEYLKSLKLDSDASSKNIDNEISVEIVSSNLFLDDKNLLFFATGTGITLPRSVIHHFKDKNIRIYYGFRHYNVDQLCKEEFNNVKMFCASSRDDNKYVMDVYRDNPVENIDDWLVFVSGNCRLNKEIKLLLKEVHGKEVVFQSETW